MSEADDQKTDEKVEVVSPEIEKPDLTSEKLDELITLQKETNDLYSKILTKLEEDSLTDQKIKAEEQLNQEKVLIEIVDQLKDENHQSKALNTLIEGQTKKETEKLESIKTGIEDYSSIMSKKFDSMDTKLTTLIEENPEEIIQETSYASDLVILGSVFLVFPIILIWKICDYFFKDVVA